MTNEELASRLRAHARWLSQRGDNLYRIRAFRQATMAVLELQEPFQEVLERTGLVPGVGASIAETLLQYAKTGVWNAEDRVAGRVVRKTPSGETERSISPDSFAIGSIA